MSKSACIFGSTGLIGSYLLEELIKDERYSEVIVFNRTRKDIDHQKLKQVVTDYSQLNEKASELKADEYYCCLGTTMKKAKTKEAFEYVDYQLPLEIARLAKRNEVDRFFVVSSIGASAKSNNFYLRTKGQMEDDISVLGIEHLHFFRPSLLLGKRKEKRFGESLGKAVIKLFGFLMIGGLKKYRAIHGTTIAKAMIKVANSDIAQRVFISDEIQELGTFS